MLYTLYSAPISRIIEEHGLSSCNAVCTWQAFYVTFHPQDHWYSFMGSKEHVKINAHKTELLHFPRFNPSSSPPSVIVYGHSVHDTYSTKLGHSYGSAPTTSGICKNICRSSISALKRISQIGNFLSKESTEKLIHTFFIFRIDFVMLFLAFHRKISPNCILYKIVLHELKNVKGDVDTPALVTCIQCEFKKRKLRFNFKSLKNEKRNHRTNIREW